MKIIRQANEEPKLRGEALKCAVGMYIKLRILETYKIRKG